jgi:hypothetical protein
MGYSVVMEINTNHQPRPMSPDRVRFAMARSAARAINEGNPGEALEIRRDIHWYEDKLSDVLQAEVARLLG